MSILKASGSTREVEWKLPDLRPGEESGTAGVAVECVDIGGNTIGEGGFLSWF
jgi:hypothetical protein